MILCFPTNFYAFRTIITDQGGGKNAPPQVDYAIKKTQVD